MPNTSQPKRKVSFRPIAASVRTNKNGSGVFFDVTFKCVLVSGTGVRLGHKETLLFMQLAEGAYEKIFDLLANSPKAKKSRKRSA